jgi:hypothetical protein
LTTCPLAEQAKPAVEVEDRKVVPSGRTSRTEIGVPPTAPGFETVSVNVMMSPITAGAVGPDFVREKSNLPVGVVVAVGVTVGERVGVLVGVIVRVFVDVLVEVAVGVIVRVFVGVGVETGQPNTWNRRGSLLAEPQVPPWSAVKA